MKPDLVDTVVPPKITEEIVKVCKDLGIKNVWMQPGSESEEALRFCKANGINVNNYACAMIQRRRNWQKP